MFIYNQFLTLDFRSKTPLSEQLIEKFYLLIQDHSLNNGDLISPIYEMSQALNVSEEVVSKAYKSLEKQRLIECIDGQQYRVSFKRFSHDYYGGLMTILDLIRHNGYEPTTRKEPSEILSEAMLKKRGIVFDIPGPFHVMRIDYLADDIVFAVTYSYVPKSVVHDFDEALRLGENVNDYFKKITPYLKPVSTIKSVIYPTWVADVLKIPYRRAGLLVSNKFYDNQNRLIHLQELYVNHFYEVYLKNDIQDFQTINR